MNGYWGKINSLVCERANPWLPVKSRNGGLALTPCLGSSGGSVLGGLHVSQGGALLDGLHPRSALALSQLWVPDLWRPECLWGPCGPSPNQWGHLMGRGRRSCKRSGEWEGDGVMTVPSAAGAWLPSPAPSPCRAWSLTLVHQGTPGRRGSLSGAGPGSRWPSQRGDLGRCALTGLCLCLVVCEMVIVTVSRSRGGYRDRCCPRTIFSGNRSVM